MPVFGPIGSFPVSAFPDSGNIYPPPSPLLLHGTNVTSNQRFLTAGRLALHGVTPTLVLAAPRVTWVGVEVAHRGASRPRVSWMGVEVLRTNFSAPTLWVVSWMGIEALHVGAAAARVSWMGAEVPHVGDAADRVSWFGVEVLRSVLDRPPDSGWVSLIAA